MSKRAVVAGSIVVILVAAGSGWIAHERGSSSAAPTPTRSPTASTHPKGPTRLDVPSVLGMPVDQAIARLTRLGLESNVTSGLVLTYPNRGVLRQTPKAGTTVPPGTTIMLYIA